MPNRSDPYGIAELEPNLIKSKPPGRIRCPVRGCEYWLKPPTRKPKFKGEPCPAHGILVHNSGTYCYVDYRRNLPIGGDYFAKHIRSHPFKYETHRFGAECSEDGLSLCVFYGLQQAGCLGQVVELCTGIKPRREPRLFLWGLEIELDGVEPWDLVIEARDQFESDLPVTRPKTEPDIAVHVPGGFLLLIEAKFTSKNPSYQRDKNKLLDLTIDQLVQIYQWPGMRFIDIEAARRRDLLLYQLYRNAVFADFMSQTDSCNTQSYVVNLVREGYEANVCEPMLTLMPKNYRDRFNQIHWEQLFDLPVKPGRTAFVTTCSTRRPSSNRHSDSPKASPLHTLTTLVSYPSRQSDRLSSPGYTDTCVGSVYTDCCRSSRSFGAPRVTTRVAWPSGSDAAGGMCTETWPFWNSRVSPSITIRPIPRAGPTASDRTGGSLRWG